MTNLGGETVLIIKREKKVELFQTITGKVIRLNNEPLRMSA